MTEYLVLARKYRPQTFEHLVGQEVLVRTLTNAIAANRIAHAFVLTGIRGIGKTTTARIIAKALNCIGVDGQGKEATATPCGVCSQCTQIAEGRHLDVLEMDAASHTGVDKMRDLTDSVHYQPSAGRFKVYIIDEAHMLTTQSFNALLKTLEEPPAHVVFIFATTEIRKIPVTILSRCQRFDLRRLVSEEMVTHLRSICEREQVEAEDAALELVAIAAEGSVRDALSLLDQAIVHSEKDADGRYSVSADVVRGLLGLVDRTRLYAMLSHLFAGECQAALAALEAQYRDGANMATLIGDMMGAVHVVSRLLVAPTYTLDHTYADSEKAALQALARELSIPAAARAWQLLSKGLEEVKRAPNALAATEMLFIRFAYTAQMPDPAKIIKQLQEGGTGTVAAIHVPSGGSGGGTSATIAYSAPLATALAISAPAPATHLALVAQNDTPPELYSFEQVLALCEREKERILLHHLTHDVRVVVCAGSELVIASNSAFPAEMLTQLRAMMKRAHGWTVRVSEEAGAPSIAEQKSILRTAQMQAATSHPLVEAILATFDGAAMVDIQPD
jgi:DNA polymerase III subunit gamma/tau